MIQNVEEGKIQILVSLIFLPKEVSLAKKCLNRKQMTLYCVGVWSPLGIQESLRHAQITLLWWYGNPGNPLLGAGALLLVIVDI